MSNNQKYWFVVAAAILTAVLFALLGCDGLEGTANCRFADKIIVSGDLRPTNPILGEYGWATYAECNFRAAYTCNGSVIESEGMPMVLATPFNQNYYVYGSPNYWYPSQDLTLNYTGQTDGEGFVIGDIERNFTPDYWLHSGAASLGHPNRPSITRCVSACFQNRLKCGTGDKLHWYAIVREWCNGRDLEFRGGFYYSGSNFTDTLVGTLNDSGVSTCSSIIPDNSPPAPAFGFTLCQIDTVKEKNGLMMKADFAALITKDPNAIANATGNRFRVILRCAEPVSIAGLVLTGECKVTHPSGSPSVFTFPMTATAVNDNEDEYVTILSEPIVTIEPYCYKQQNGMPYNPPNPYRDGDKLIVPVKLDMFGSPATTIKYKITGIDKASAVMVLSKYWLSGNKTLDMNHDGIVNWKDANFDGL